MANDHFHITVVLENGCKTFVAVVVLSL